MREIVKDLIHTHIVGDDTPERIVAAQAYPAMRGTKIDLTGLTDAGRDYLMIRVRPHFEHLLVCLGGEGQVLVDDRWRPCGAGLAYLAPVVATHAFRTVGRRRWRFCWVMYEGPKPGELPVIGGDRPRLVDADPRGLWSSIEGLYQEAVGSAEPLMLDRWAALVQSQAARVVDPHHERDPLWQLWAAVTADLAAAWSLDRLASRACISAEHLRRLCVRHTGRTPMEHVAQLRMARATALLESTPMKVAAVARAVGYSNPFSFSTAFRRIKGVSPATRRRTKGDMRGGQRRI